MREKCGKKVISICIIACILISSYGTIIAQGMGLLRRSQINDMLSTYLLDVVSLDKVIDINDNCEKNEVNFSLNDGTNTVYSFAEPVWFKDSAGNMSFKDVNIKKHKNPVFKKKGYEYSNGENDYRIYFSTSCEKGLLIENTDISFNIIPKTNYKGISGDVSQIEKDEKNIDVFSYSNIYGEGTKLVYTPQLNGVKEEIIIDKYTGQNKFEFEVNTKNCYLEINDGIVWFKSSDTNEVVQSMNLPFAYDSNNKGVDSGDEHYTSECKYDIEKVSDEKYKLTLIVSDKWLKSDKTVYPVTIDPVTSSIDNTQDTPIYSNKLLSFGRSNANDDNTVGYKFVSPGTCRSLVKFEIPSTIKPGSKINSATYTMYQIDGSNKDMAIDIHKITGDWEESVVWKNAPTYDTKKISTKNVPLIKEGTGVKGKVDFDITDAVKSWNDGDTNNGLLFKWDNEKIIGLSNYRTFASKEYFDVSCRPYSIINYTSDTTAPSVESVTGNTSTSDWTTQAVTLTVNGATDMESGLHTMPYSFSTQKGEYNWQASNISPTYTSPQTIYVYVRDLAENIRLCSTEKIKVDAQAPTIKDVTGNTKSWINESITLTVNGASDSNGAGLHKLPYSFSTKEEEYNWQSSNTKSFDKNQTVYIYLRDSLGNVALRDTIVIDKIDKSIPTINSIDKTVENNNIILTVNATDNISGIKEYSFDNGKTWQESNTKSFTSIENVKIKVKDKSGNESEYIPPSPIDPKVIEVTDKSATISWTAPTDSIEIAEYKIYSGNNLIGTTKNTSYTVTDLENVKEYIFTIKAVNIFGDVSEDSVNITVVTGIGVPENIAVEAGTNYIDVSWDMLSGATEYEVEVEGVVYSGITQNTFRCASLNQGTTYTIKVRAKALTVVGQWSKELKTTTGIPQEVSGTINHNAIWYASKSPYIITGDIIVDDNATLNIEAGTIIMVKDGCKIVVNGKLVAQGTKDLPIVFTSYYDKEYGGTGEKRWGGIEGQSENSEIIIHNALIRYACIKEQDYAILASGKLILTHSTIEESVGCGINFVGISDSVISNNIIKTVLKAIKVKTKMPANITVSENLIDSVVDGVEFIMDEKSSLTFNSNRIASGIFSVWIDCKNTKSIVMEGNNSEFKELPDKFKAYEQGAYGFFDLFLNTQEFDSTTVEILSKNNFNKKLFFDVKITENITLPRGTYTIANIEVLEGVKLAIEEGSTFKVLNYGRIGVLGELEAIGTSTMPIKFTLFEYENIDDPKYIIYWQGVLVAPQGKAILDNIILERALTGCGVSGELSMSNSQITKNRTCGIQVENNDLEFLNKDVKIYNNNISDNENGIFINASVPTNLTIKNNNLLNNKRDGVTLYCFLGDFLFTPEPQDLVYKEHIFPGCEMTDRDEEVLSLPDYKIRGKEFVFEGNTMRGNSRYSFSVLFPTFRSDCLSGFENNVFDDTIFLESMLFYKEFTLLKANYEIGVCIVDENATLTIKGGSLFKTRFGSFFNEGKLVLEGTEDENIIMTSSNDPVYGGDASRFWGGIINSGELVATYTRFKYGGNIGYKYGKPGEPSRVFIRSCIMSTGLLNITKSTFENCASAIEFCQGSDLNSKVNFNSFINNNGMGILNCQEGELDASYNYWGSVYGPSVVDLEEGYYYQTGGDAVCGNICYAPYFADEFSLASNFGIDGTYGPTGSFSRQYTDLSMKNSIDSFDISRTYNSRNDKGSLMGRGWTFCLEASISDYTMELVGAGGIPQTYTDSSIKTVRLMDGSVSMFTYSGNDIYKSNDSRNTLKKVGKTYVMTTKEQASYCFGSNGKLIWISDRYGNKTTINYNSAGNPVSVVDYTNRAYAISYNSDNKISSIKDTISNRTVEYSYKNGNLVQVKDPMGYKTYYTYDSENYLIGVHNNNDNLIDGITYIHSQDANKGKVKTMTDAYGNVSTYNYDIENKKVSISDKNGRKTTQHYDNNMAVTMIVDEQGKSTIIEYPENNLFGEEQSVTDRNGNKTEYLRDDRGNITFITNPDKSNKRIEYDEKNNVTFIRDEDYKTTYFEYDQTGSSLIKKYENSSYVSESPNQSNQSQYNITSYTYYPESKYGIKGLVQTQTDPMGGTITYTYDQYGNISTQTDEEGKTTTYAYNSIGQLVLTVSPGGYETSYCYDSNGNQIKKVLDSGETYRTIYDSSGNVVREISPNQYKSTNDLNGTYISDVGERYTYYQNNLLHTKTDSNGNTTSYTYDDYGNILTETLPNGLVYRFEYDVMDRVVKKYCKENSTSSENLLVEYEYNIVQEENKNLTETIIKMYKDENTFVVKKSYEDYANREVKVINPDNGVIKTLYNKNGTVATQTNASGNTTHYYYDDMNRVIKKMVQVSQNAYSYYGYEYDKSSKLIKESVGVDLIALNSYAYNTIKKSYEYYKDGKLKVESYDNGAKTVYSYDADGNLNKKEEFVDSSKSNITEYEYNQLGKVTKVKQLARKGDFLGNNFTDDKIVTLTTVNTYDLNGNLKTTTSPSGAVTVNTYDDMDNLLTTSMIGVDEFGKTTQITTSNTYNNIGKLVTQTDALGNTTQYTYDGQGNLIKKIDANGRITAHYYDFIGNLVAVVSPKNYKENKSLSEMNRTEYAYNNMGNVITQTQVYFDAKQNLWISFVEKAYAYDSQGNVVKQLDASGYEAGTGQTVNEKIANGFGTEFTYDGENQVLTELSAQDKAEGRAFTLSYTYDGLGRKLTEKNARGVTTLYSYDDLGNVISVKIKATESSPEQTIAKYTYDYLGNKLSETDANGNKTQYTYNVLGKLASQIFAGDTTIASITRYCQYDFSGNLIKQWDTSGKMTSKIYDNQNRLISTTSSKIDGTQAITFTYGYDINGKLRFETDGNGIKTEYTYDKLGRKLTQSKAGKTTSYTYDANDNLLKTTDWLGNTYTNVYDELNRVVKKLDPLGNTIEILEFNNNHQQVSSTDALGHTTQFAYDNVGRLIKTTDPAGNTQEKTYDSTGNILSQKDGNENITQYTYDEFNKLTSVTLANNETTLYTYDANGNMLTQTDARGITTTFEYNVANLKTKIIDHGGKTLVDGAVDYDTSKVQSFTYTSDGLVATQTCRNGTVISYTYDVHGRVKTKTGSNQTGVQTVSYSYDNNNNLLTVADKSGTITRTYDDFNRVLTKKVENIGTTNYTYDITENQPSGEYSQTTSYPQAESVTQSFDKSGRLSKVIVNGDTTKYNYYDNGSVKSVVYGNGAKEEYSYTPNNLLDTLTNKKADGTVINSYSYLYDNEGNILSKTDEVGTTSYTYDSLNRLVTEICPDEKTISNTYDASGNRLMQTSVKDEKTTVVLYEYDTSNRLIQTETKVEGDTTQITSYKYDANGNMLEKRLTPFINSTPQDQIVKLTNVYDNFNQLTMSITDDGKTVCNVYNGEGLRIQKSVDGVATNYLYEGMKVVAEYDENYKLKAQNIQGTNLLTRIEKNAKYYYMYNGHADVTALLNAKTGNVDATYYYDAFGTVLSQTGNVNNSYLYAGYQYDEETQLYYLNARMYDSQTARFIQEDTYRGNPNDPLSLNLYTYCENNPLVYHDPTGHFPQWVNKLKKTVGKAWKWLTNTPDSPVPDVEDKKSSKSSNKKSDKSNKSTKSTSNVKSNNKNKKQDNLPITTPEKHQKKLKEQINKPFFDIDNIQQNNLQTNNWNIANNVIRNSVEGVADQIVGGKIQGLPDVKKYYTKYPKFGPAMQAETTITRSGTKALKGFSKIAGPMAAASYGYDVYEDVKKYDGKDTAKAVTVTTASTALTIGAGFAVSGIGAPVGGVIIVGALAGAGIGYIGDKIKDKWIGN